jgi:hypothetical protein
MGVISKNTPIKLILSITLCIDHDQINSIGVFSPITPTKFILSQYYNLFSDKINLIGVFLPITLIKFIDFRKIGRWPGRRTLPLGCLDDEIMVPKSPQ